MEKPVRKREPVPITGTPDPDPDLEAKAIRMFRLIEGILDRIFNTHTALNKARGISEVLGMDVPSMPPMKGTIPCDTQLEGSRLGLVAKDMAEEMTDDRGERFLTRLRVLLQPVMHKRIKWDAETTEWDEYRERIKRK